MKRRELEKQVLGVSVAALPNGERFFFVKGQRELAFISNSLYYLSYNSLGVNLEKLVLDEPVIL